jgi:hypothetical protein
MAIVTQVTQNLEIHPHRKGESNNVAQYNYPPSSLRIYISYMRNLRNFV